MIIVLIVDVHCQQKQLVFPVHAPYINGERFLHLNRKKKLTNMRKKTSVIRKIILEQFIEMLMDVYDSGVDVINIVIETGKKQDTIYIADADEDIEREMKEEERQEILSIDDLDKLV